MSENNDEEDMDCEYCNGTGEVPTSNGTTTCPECNGTGRFP